MTIEEIRANVGNTVWLVDIISDHSQSIVPATLIGEFLSFNGYNARVDHPDKNCHPIDMVHPTEEAARQAIRDYSLDRAAHHMKMYEKWSDIAGKWSDGEDG